MLKLNAIHNQGGFALFKEGSKLYLLSAPYSDEGVVEIQESEVGKLLRAPNWYSFSRPRRLDGREALYSMMRSESSVNSILRVMELEKQANQGRMMICSEQEKVDRLVEKLEALSRFSMHAIKILFNVAAISHVYRRTQAQQAKLKVIRQTMEPRCKEGAVIAQIPESRSSQIRLPELMAYVEKEMMFQKRYQVAQTVVKFLLSNAAWFDESEMQSLRDMYARVREAEAASKGRSTSTSIKRAAKSKAVIKKKRRG